MVQSRFLVLGPYLILLYLVIGFPYNYLQGDLSAMTTRQLQSLKQILVLAKEMVTSRLCAVNDAIQKKQDEDESHSRVLQWINIKIDLAGCFWHS